MYSLPLLKTAVRPVTVRLFTGFLIFALGPLLATAWSQSVEPPTVRYEVSFNDAPLHIADVTLSVATSGNDELEFLLPTWTPGSYLIREYARHIFKIDAVDPASGRPLPIRKSKKNRWIVSTMDSVAVQLRYRVYGNEMSVRTNFVDGDWALLNGAATFLTIAAERDQPHQVRFVLPAGWTDVVTELPTADGSDTKFVASTYDDLVDAPVVAGSPSVATFTVGGKPHRLVCVGDTDLWNPAAAAKDLRKLIDVQRAFWGSLPYQRYTFINVIGESGGGLEHDNSTVLMTSRWTQGLPDRYRRWLSLCSHEFFHAWNVRRLRPRTLLRYDYENEQLFPELWIAEGITSYYDDLLVRRAGLMSTKDYLKNLGASIARVQTAPGRKVQSLRDSSIDTWIKHYRPDENSINTRISYYTKGMLVAWLLDAEIRSSTEGKKSLDDVMRLLYQRHAEVGYDASDFRSIASEVAETDLSDWFALNVDSAGEMDFSQALDHFGLHWSETPDPTIKTDDGETESDDGETNEEDEVEEVEDETDDKAAWDLGISTREQGGRLIITRVRHDGPAAEAGLSVDDELIAVDGYRASRSRLDDQLKVLVEASQSVELILARRGKVIRRTIRPIHKPEATWKLKLNANAEDDILENRSSWLGEARQPGK